MYREGQYSLLYKSFSLEKQIRGENVEYTTEIITIKNVDNIEIDINVFHLVLSDFSTIRDTIENEIVDIWETNIGYTLDVVKRDIYNVITSKSDIQKHGLVAEFFMHLFLRDLGYEQKCVFSNLEENSMKKGFDGFYEFANEFWIAESKSAITEVKHKDKIREAIVDIDYKVRNTEGNNPWKNALHHIMIRQHGRKDDSLSKKVLSLSSDYIKKVNHDSSEFNLIPTSTLFVNNNQSDSEIKKELEEIISGRKIKEMIVLCVNNDMYNEFIDYLNGE